MPARFVAPSWTDMQAISPNLPDPAILVSREAIGPPVIRRCPNLSGVVLWGLRFSFLMLSRCPFGPGNQSESMFSARRFSPLASTSQRPKTFHQADEKRQDQAAGSLEGTLAAWRGLNASGERLIELGQLLGSDRFMSAFWRWHQDQICRRSTLVWLARSSRLGAAGLFSFSGKLSMRISFFSFAATISCTSTKLTTRELVGPRPSF